VIIRPVGTLDVWVDDDRVTVFVVAGIDWGCICLDYKTNNA